jgi:hypothetical protein
MNQDLAIAADQKGVATAVEIQRVDGLDQGVQAQVATHDADRLAVAAHGGGSDGEDGLAVGGIDVGLGENGPTRTHGIGVPGPRACIVAFGHGVRWLQKVVAGDVAQVGEVKVGQQGFLLEQRAHGFGSGVQGNALGQGFGQQNATREPVLDVGGRGAAHFVQVAFQVVANGVALQVIVVQGEQREGCSHDERGGQENLVAEFQGFLHGR